MKRRKNLRSLIILMDKQNPIRLRQMLCMRMKIQRRNFRAKIMKAKLKEVDKEKMVRIQAIVTSLLPLLLHTTLALLPIDV